MPLLPGETKIDQIVPEEWDYTKNPPVRVHKVFFSVRGVSGYSVMVPVDMFTPQALKKLVIDKATAIADALDLSL